MPTLHLTQDDAADELLGRDPLALLLGMLLDQQVPMERAFAAPRTLADRLGTDPLSAHAVADADPDELVAVFSATPALHRYPGSMAARAQELCRALVERHDGSASAVWEGAADGRDLRRRLEALPGFGPQKAAVMVALLGKRCGVRPEGWREAAGDYGAEGAHRSVADVVDGESLARVRAAKQELKRAAREARAAKG